jgi:hypothetical protein
MTESTGLCESTGGAGILCPASIVDVKRTVAERAHMKGCCEDSRPRRECRGLAEQIVPDHHLSLRSLVGVDTVMVVSWRGAAPERLTPLQSDCC